MLLKALPKPPEWPAGFVNWVCATEQQRCRQQSHLSGEHFHFLFGKGIWNVAFEVGEGCLSGAAGWMGWVGARPAVLRKAACAALCRNVSGGQCCLLGSALRSGVRKIQNVSWSGVTSQKQINNAAARSCSNLQRIVSLRVCPLLWPWLVLFPIQRVVWGINSKETPVILLCNFLKDFLTTEERGSDLLGFLYQPNFPVKTQSVICRGFQEAGLIHSGHVWQGYWGQEEQISVHECHLLFPLPLSTKFCLRQCIVQFLAFFSSAVQSFGKHIRSSYTCFFSPHFFTFFYRDRVT